MSREDVFEMVRNGDMSFEDFNEWCAVQQGEAYCEGAYTQRYEDSTAPQDRGD